MEGSILTGVPKVIDLIGNVSINVSYTGTGEVTFTLPSGYTYFGAGVSSATLSGNYAGGIKGDFVITFDNNKTITLNVTVAGNYGNTTITGTIGLKVFVM